MKLFRFLLFPILITFVVKTAVAQSPNILRNDQIHHTYDRFEILRKSDTTLVNGINNYDRKESMIFFRRSLSDPNMTQKDKYDLEHFMADNYEFLPSYERVSVDSIQNDIFRAGQSDIDDDAFVKQSKKDFERKPFLKYFYKTPANFIQLETPSFKMYINPVVQLTYLNEKNNANTVFQNTRGIELRAYIDEKVYVYTQLLENQRSYLSFVDDRIQKFGTLPGQGFWKSYSSSIIGNLNGYDFFNARAYIGFNPVKSINIEFGHGSHFIGNGIRSLLLSDYSHNYLYLKFNTRIWKFQYQNIFAELAPTSTLRNPGDNVLPKKYSATHYLAFKPNAKFEIGLFETVIFARENHFEFQYLNPVILYRAVEHFLDSPDNVMLGLNIKVNPIKGISLYGQLILDEFKLSEVRKQTGWWANKFGGQLGIKYLNAFGIDHLDLQLEHNVVRPYTYSHRDTLPTLGDYSIANYAHSNQPLAHPIGANFRETILIARFKPHNRIYLTGKALFTTYGDDRPGENWGGNILLPLENRQLEYGNVVGQGLKTDVMAINFDASYEFYHNYFFDVQAMWRQTSVEGVAKDQHYLGAGFRINIGQITYDY